MGITQKFAVAHSRSRSMPTTVVYAEYGGDDVLCCQAANKFVAEKERNDEMRSEPSLM